MNVGSNAFYNMLFVHTVSSFLLGMAVMWLILDKPDKDNHA